MFYLAFKNKKFKRFLLIESVLIIVFIIGRQMYTSNLNTMDTVMWSLASDVTNKMITQSDKNIEIKDVIQSYEKDELIEFVEDDKEDELNKIDENLIILANRI